MIVTLPLPPKLTNEFPEVMVTFLQWFAFWTFAGLLIVPWLFCVFQLVTHSVGRKRRIKHVLNEQTAPKVVIVMPCYKEVPDILLRTVDSLVDCEYPPSCLHIFLSFDGDQEDDLYLSTIEKLGVPMTLKTYPKSIDLAYRSTRITVSRFPHGGKRHCQKQTFRLIDKIYTLYTKHHDDLFVLFIDSDCILDKVCIQNFMYEMELKPGSKRNMLAMTGVITSTTEKHSLITILQDMEYIHGQLFERSVESACGAVTCLPGALTILRFSAFRKMAKYYFADKAEQCDDLFDYGKCHLGEDRWLTHLFMIGAKNRYQIQMNTGAFCKTEAVQTFRSLLKQRRRWFLGFITNEVCMLTDIRLWRQYPILCVVRFAQNTIRTTALLFFIMVISLITTSQKISQLPVGFIAVSLGLNWALMLYFAARLGRYKIMLYPLMFVVNPFFNWLYMIYGIFTAGQRTWGGPRADAGAADTKVTPGAVIERAEATGDDLNVIPETFKPAIESVTRRKSIKSTVQPSQGVEGRFTSSQLDHHGGRQTDEEAKDFVPDSPNGFLPNSRRHSAESWRTTHTKQSIVTPRRVESFVTPADALAYQNAQASQPAAGGAFFETTPPDSSRSRQHHGLNRASTIPLRHPASSPVRHPPRVLQPSTSSYSYSSSPLSSEPSSPELMPTSFNPYAPPPPRGRRRDRDRAPFLPTPTRLEALSPTTEESSTQSRIGHRDTLELRPLSSHTLEQPVPAAAAASAAAAARPSTSASVNRNPRSSGETPPPLSTSRRFSNDIVTPDRPRKLRRRSSSSEAGPRGGGRVSQASRGERRTTATTRASGESMRGQSAGVDGSRERRKLVKRQSASSERH